jgi:hypothetical protein
MDSATPWYPARAAAPPYNNMGRLHSRAHVCPSFRDIIESADVKTLPLPARSPNFNAFAERWVKSVKDDCLSKLILFGETSLRRALREYPVNYHAHEIIGVKTTYCYFQPLRRQ